MTHFDEAALVARCKAGEEAAFRELVDHYKDLVFGLITRTVPDRPRAEDLAQEVFLRIHKGLPYFRGDARLSTWVYRIVLNLCAQQAGSARLLEFSLDELDPSGRPRVQPVARDTAVSDMELRDRLEKAIARLPVHYRALIAGHYLSGVGYEDLADALGLPLGTVKTHLYRAKKQLRLLLETEFR